MIVPDALARLWVESAYASVSRILRKIDEWHTPDISISGSIFLLAFPINTAIFPIGEIEALSQRVVTRGIPVGGALHSRPEIGSLWTRLRVRETNRMAGRVQAAGPGLLREGGTEQELTGLPIEHIEETAAVRPVHQLAGLAAPVVVDQDGHLHRIPIVDVVRDELEIPFQLAGVCIERDGAIGVKVVSFSGISIPIGRGIP